MFEKKPYGQVIRCECSAEEFFKVLASRSEKYDEQQFIAPLDGTIISKSVPPQFKLWCRVSGCNPVVTGKVGVQDGELQIAWSSRLPLPMSLGYAFIALVFLYGAGLGGIKYSSITVLILVLWLVVLKLHGRKWKMKIEDLLRECAQGIR